LLWKWASLSTEALSGHPGDVGFFAGDFEREVKEDSGNRAFLSGSSVRGTWREDFFTGNSKRVVKEGS
jgi:hypothetical protein